MEGLKKRMSSTWEGKSESTAGREAVCAYVCMISEGESDAS